MTIIGIDPGNTHSAGIVLTDSGPADFAYQTNDAFLVWLKQVRHKYGHPQVACEMIASYGMSVGKTIFETCVMIGRIYAACPDMVRIARIQVKSTVCHNSRAKDANIKTALVDRWGPVGTKKSPGPCYGIANDVWAALAVATAVRDGAILYEP